jgi:hypothetical protein
MVYCADRASISIDLSKLGGGGYEAFWVDPRSAEKLAIGRVAGVATAPFSTPDGWEDALLVLEAG